MATTDVSDELWTEFHRLVNMTSRELLEWMRSESAGEVAEELPDAAGTDDGQAVAAILGKRRADLTAHDIAVMERVVSVVRSERGDEELEPTAGDAAWRHRLMSLGHDPLKPVE
jgi:hypothetical protein